MAGESPLGKQTDYPDTYTPGLLFAIPRARSREPLGIGDRLPFHGVDLWNAWELTWLSPGGRPCVATAEIRVPADSPNIVESKSLKLYLNSFAMTSFASIADVSRTISADIGASVGAGVDVELATPAETEGRGTAVLPGTLLDNLDIACDATEVDPALLSSDPSDLVRESLHTHLLRSLCPVTAQPDSGSLLVDYEGPRIDRVGLLRYVISFRRHQDFHEACVERMYSDVLARCAPGRLTVHARYQRRGGIDINPYRSSATGRPDNLRLWRQ